MLATFPVVATIPVTDLDRSRQFYREILGLREVMANPFVALMEAGEGTRLSLFRRPPVSAEHTLAHFEVERLNDLVIELQARGVAFEEYDTPTLRTVDYIAEMGPVRSAWFRDPDGDILGLREVNVMAAAG